MSVLIQYRTIGNIALTPCPYNVHSKVGSFSCRECKYYKSKKGKVIKCSYEKENKNGV